MTKFDLLSRVYRAILERFSVHSRDIFRILRIIFSHDGSLQFCASFDLLRELIIEPYDTVANRRPHSERFLYVGYLFLQYRDALIDDLASFKLRPLLTCRILR